MLAAQGEGLASICFRTSDIAKTHRRLDRLTLKPEPVAEVESRDAISGAALSWKRTRAATEATRGVRLFFLERDTERPLSARTTGGSIAALDHVVVSTSDPERAAALYGARLGLDMALDRSHPDWGRLMFFRCGDLIVEVTHRPGKEGDASQDRLRGLCWRVADMDATHARLAQAGVDVSEVRNGRKPGTRVMTVRSGTCGVPTLLVQPSVGPTVLTACTASSSHFANDLHVLKPALACYSLLSSEHRAADLAKAKRVLKWQRDPEGMRLRILEAAKQEFAAHGLAGARVDRIAANAGANKRMLYYHVGNKEDLYLAVLEGAYEKIRSEERGLDLEHLDPPEAIERLIDFTWNYFLRNPEFLALLNTENLAKARHLKRSTKVKSMHSPFVEMIRTVVRRGVESGDFRVAVDPVQLYISIAGLCFFYLSNSATLSVIFGRDLLKKEARDERLAHMVALVLAALTGKSTADFGKVEMRGARTPAHQPV